MKHEFSNNTNFTKGFLSAIGAVFCFSVITTFGVIVYQNGVSPLSLLTFRAVVAGFLMFLTVLLNKSLSFKIKRGDRFRVFMHSLLLGGTLILFWEGTNILRHIPTVYAGYFTYPFWAAILAGIFLKEKFTKYKWLSLFLGTLGTLFALGFLPSLSPSGLKLYGIGLVLLSAILWGVAVLVGQVIFKKYDVKIVLFYNFLVTAVLFVLLQSPVVLVSQLTSAVLPYMLLIAVVSTYFAYILFSKAIKYFGGTNWGIANLSSPIFNGAVAFLLLNQTVGGYQALGIGLSMIGVCLLYKKGGK